MREYGLDRAVQTAAHRFTRGLAGLTEAAGVSFHYGHEVLAARTGPDGVSGVLVRSAGGGERTLVADAYVAALGSHTALLMRSLGVSIPVYPAKGYSVTLEVADAFPGGADYDQPVFWAGLRPATPSNVPLIGRTRLPNLYLNTGHGTLGWTLGAGSGRALADILSGRKPEVDFPFLGPA